MAFLTCGESIRLCDCWADIFTNPAQQRKSFRSDLQGCWPWGRVQQWPPFRSSSAGITRIGFFPPCAGPSAHLGRQKGGHHPLRSSVDTKENDLDERMHTCPWFHATNRQRAGRERWCNWAIGSWQVPPRRGGRSARERGNPRGLNRHRTSATWAWRRLPSSQIERANRRHDCVYNLLLISTASTPFPWPGNGWPEPGGCLAREALKLLGG